MRMAASNMVSLVMAGVLLTLSACSANTSQPDHTDIPLQSEMVQSEVIQSSAEGQFEEDHKPDSKILMRYIAAWRNMRAVGINTR